jgi:hypothetical protein
MKTDEEILDEYIKEMEWQIPQDNRGFLLPFVKELRKQEPRINSGIHLVMFCCLVKDTQTMDGTYGPDWDKK